MIGNAIPAQQACSKSAAEAAEDSDAVQVLGLHSVALMEEVPPSLPSCPRRHWLRKESHRRHMCDLCGQRGTEYRCSECDHDLCKSCFNRAKVQARLGPCCPKWHLLKPEPKRGNFCDSCGVRGTAYRCPEGCDFDICRPCFDSVNARMQVPLHGLVKSSYSFSSLLDEDVETSTLAGESVAGESDAASLQGSCSVTSKTSMAKLWMGAWEEEQSRHGFLSDIDSDDDYNDEYEASRFHDLEIALEASDVQWQAPEITPREEPPLQTSEIVKIPRSGLPNQKADDAEPKQQVVRRSAEQDGWLEWIWK